MPHPLTHCIMCRLTGVRLHTPVSRPSPLSTPSCAAAHSIRPPSPSVNDGHVCTWSAWAPGHSTSEAFARAGAQAGQQSPAAVLGSGQRQQRSGFAQSCAELRAAGRGRPGGAAGRHVVGRGGGLPSSVLGPRSGDQRHPAPVCSFGGPVAPPPPHQVPIPPGQSAPAPGVDCHPKRQHVWARDRAEEAQGACSRESRLASAAERERCGAGPLRLQSAQQAYRVACSTPAAAGGAQRRPCLGGGGKAAGGRSTAGGRQRPLLCCACRRWLSCVTSSPSGGRTPRA